jgi:membrane peptidoglycan carboxypeptidase
VAIKIKIPKSGAQGAKKWRGLPRDPVIRAALVIFLVAALGVGGVLSYFYIKYDRIIEKRFQTPVFTAYELEPQLVTALFEGQDRSKRELIKFQDIPPVLVNAVLAIEDRRFFQHGGVNYIRLLEAAAVDVREGRHEQGGSTITMQLSRGFFLTPEKTLKRKLTEMMIAIELEQKFSKQRIFRDVCQ